MEIDLTQEEFNRRVEENTKTFLFQNETNSFDVSKYHLATHQKGELSIPILMMNIHDIYASIIIGALASPKRHGCDAIFMNNNIISHIELKTSYITRNFIWKTEDGKVKTGISNTRDHKRSLKSYLKADYKITESSLPNKFLDTYLVCIDASSNEVICTYKLEKEKIPLLLAYKSGSTIKGYYRKSISLNQFIDLGTEVISKVPQLGYDKWINKIHKDIPTLKYGESRDAY